MKNEKKPDHVVYNTETERYDAFLKPYATSLSAPVITTTDSLAWKNRNINKVNKHVQAKYNELKTAYTEMMQQYEYNNLVYGAKFNFEPIVGEIYHLYKRTDASIFLSIIAPEECNFNHVNSFYLDADGIWHKK
ncbi:DUF2452 domain-containing protein [Winogradskyella sp.]|nr:DUF2452 domain-containing protein [Winogradskyella sp.]MDC0006955.1 DUF2452 domain-containing protein [Winogradskyella sp.]MDC0006960.1 DUF2452 domain-containing protein [Winogradskyella sp.]MDC1504012.1 DUF2452 domain-containing protein [Winogradskyella sp.]